MKNAPTYFFALVVACAQPVVTLEPDARPEPVIETWCHPLLQNCGYDKCGWTVDVEPNLGHIECSPRGGRQIGATCTRTTGQSNCVKGAECDEGICKTICDPRGIKPTCDVGFACTAHEPLFTSGDVTVAGVCDRRDVTSTGTRVVR